MHYYKTPENRKGRYEPENKEPSLTVPDMAMSMAEIMQRFMRGQELPIGSNMYFDSDNGEVDFDSVDPTRDPAFDLADYTMLNEEIKRKKSEAESEQKRLRASLKETQPSAESEAKGVKEVTERSKVDDSTTKSEAKTQKVSASE